MIRHGIATEREIDTKDEERSLTEQGRRKTEKVAKQLLTLGLQFQLILTSPLTRSRQTAEILRSAGLSEQLEEAISLAPQGNINQWLEWLEGWQHASKSNLALVGHQPDLGQWASTLVWGQAQDGIILRKAGVIGLMIPDTGTPVGRSQMFWLTPPKFLLNTF